MKFPFAKSLTVAVIFVAALSLVGCGVESSGGTSTSSKLVSTSGEKLDLANGKRAVCDEENEGAYAHAEDDTYRKCEEGEWVKVKKLEALKADALLGEDAECEEDCDNADAVDSDEKKSSNSNAESKSSSSKRASFDDGEDVDDEAGETDKDDESEAADDDKSTVESKSSSSTAKSSVSAKSSSSEGTPITGCECIAASSTVDLSEVSVAEAAWTVAGCASIDPTFSYSWDGVVGTDSYTKVLKAKGDAAPKLVVRNSDNGLMELTCPTVKAVDSRSPDYLIEVVENDFDRTERIEVPSGACIQVSGRWNMDGWNPSPNFYCELSCRGECSMSLHYEGETTSWQGTYNIFGRIALKQLTEIIDYDVCVEFQSYEVDPLSAEKKDITLESLARCYISS